MADGFFGDKRKDDSNRKKPRFAFTGEEYGFGYQAVRLAVKDARRDGIADGGELSILGKKMDRSVATTTSRRRFDFAQEQLQPLRTSEQALMAVKNGDADYAVVPFYNPYSGYDYLTLRSVSNLFGLLGVEQVSATDQYCLAVHESQVLELAQSAHPASGLSALLGQKRAFGRKRDWDPDRPDYEESYPDVHDAPEHYRAGLQLNRNQQMMLRDRIDMVFAGPEAMRRCKAKLDGLRLAGADIDETPNVVEPHRELARRARASLTANRQTNTYFDPQTGETRFMSTLTGESQQASLFGVVLPFQVADMSHEYLIIDPDLEDSDPAKTRFMVVQRSPDHTLVDDDYRTTDARTRYWMTRMRALLRGAEETGHTGVRLMLRFRRDGSAASIGDVENYLRYYGVRHAAVRIGEDSEADNPAPVVLDIEFDARDFRWNPFRRMQNTVANGAIKKAFAKWKNRGALVVAAMPYVEPQLPVHKNRDVIATFNDWRADFIDTLLVRSKGFVLIALLMAAAALAFAGMAWWGSFFGG